MKREKSKLELWIERYLNAELIGYSSTQKSRYYRFNTRILRISDHVASTSDGDISVILDSHDPSNFIVHAVKTGEISVLTYAEVRQLIRSIALLPAITIVANSKEKNNTLPKDVVLEHKNVDKIIKKTANDNCVLGIPIGFFKTGQQNAIYGMVRKVKQKHGCQP